MKPRFTLKLVIVSAMLTLTVAVSAQSPVGLSFKRLFLDYQTLQDGDFGNFKDYRGGFEIGVHVPLSEDFMVNVPIKIGLGNKTDEVVNEHILGIDAQLHYYFLNNPNRFKPYLLSGVGVVYQRKDSVNIQVPVGIGVDIRIAPNAYFKLQLKIWWRSAKKKNNI